MRVFQPLGLLHGKEQRGGEDRPGRGLVLLAQHQNGELGGLGDLPVERSHGLGFVRRQGHPPCPFSHGLHQ